MPGSVLAPDKNSTFSQYLSCSPVRLSVIFFFKVGIIPAILYQFKYLSFSFRTADEVAILKSSLYAFCCANVEINCAPAEATPSAAEKTLP